MATYRVDRARCTRCGEIFHSSKCPHNNTLDVTLSEEEAARIRARYAFGKLYNPDHDTTSYRDAYTKP